MVVIIISIIILVTLEQESQRDFQVSCLEFSAETLGLARLGLREANWRKEDNVEIKQKFISSCQPPFIITEHRKYS